MKIDDKKLAFTLIELIVSMSIIVILTTIFLVNYRQSNQRTDIVMAAQLLVSDARFAQSNSLGLTKYNGMMPEGGWGIFLSSVDSENNKYIIFADINNNYQYDEGEAEENFGGKTVVLPKNITIYSLSIDNVISNNLYVTFLPPDPITRIYDGANDKNKAEIILKESVNETTKKIQINFNGLIDVVE